MKRNAKARRAVKNTVGLFCFDAVLNGKLFLKITGIRKTVIIKTTAEISRIFGRIDALL